MTRYIAADIQAKTIAARHGDDFALLGYPPRRYQRWAGVNNTTRLVLDLKDGVNEAVELITKMAKAAVSAQAPRLRDDLGCGYVVVAPTSQAGEKNVGCEAATRRRRRSALRRCRGGRSTPTRDRAAQRTPRDGRPRG